MVVRIHPGQLLFTPMKLILDTCCDYKEVVCYEILYIHGDYYDEGDVIRLDNGIAIAITGEQDKFEVMIAAACNGEYAISVQLPIDFLYQIADRCTLYRTLTPADLLILEQLKDR